MDHKGLDQIQVEIAAWIHKEFGTNVSKDEDSISFGCPLGSIPPFLGVVEELGELARVLGRRHQGRYKGTGVEAQIEKADAIADLMIFLLDLAYREGVNVHETLNVVWEKVRQRRQATWNEDKAKEGEPLKEIPLGTWDKVAKPSPTPLPKPVSDLYREAVKNIKTGEIEILGPYVNAADYYSPESGDDPGCEVGNHKCVQQTQLDRAVCVNCRQEFKLEVRDGKNWLMPLT
jgi:NTP pyrophosphatase (non-canonical NTP hydrolase)